MLKCRNVTKTYHDFVLDQVSFDLPEGMVMGLIGENGAGKTTCLSAILSAIHYEGTIEIFGKKIQELSSAEKQDIGVVLDENCFADHLTIAEIEKICHALFVKWDQKLFFDYCSEHRLPLKKKIKDFSKGMKMKLNIFTALAHHPKLLILDEATSGLDPVARDELLDVFYDFVKDGKHSILMSSHILSDIEKIADSITYISQGKLVFSESKDDLLEKYVLVRCSDEEYKALHPDSILGTRRYDYGIEACVEKTAASSMKPESITLDELMVFASRKRRGK